MVKATCSTGVDLFVSIKVVPNADLRLVRPTLLRSEDCRGCLDSLRLAYSSETYPLIIFVFC